MNERSTVLLVGDCALARPFQAALEGEGLYILDASGLLEALAHYLYFFPDLVILLSSRGSTVAEQSYFHLRSIDAGPLLILCDERWQADWGKPPSPSIRFLPLSVDDRLLLRAIRELIHPEGCSHRF